MVVLTKYRIYCNTESAWTSGWRDDTQGEPTNCFTDNGHTINENSIQILDTLNTDAQKMVIEEENIPLNAQSTNGKFRCDGYVMSVAALTTDVKVVSWPIPVSVLEVFFSAKTENDGDVINTIVKPNTIVGITTSAVGNGDTTFNVSSTVIIYVKIGYDLLIDSTLIGRVIAIDSNALTVTVDTPTTTTYNSSDTVGIQTRTIKDLTICGINQRYTIGSGKIGGMYVPANTNVHVFYENKHPTNSHDFYFEVEYTY